MNKKIKSIKVKLICTLSIVTLLLTSCFELHAVRPVGLRNNGDSCYMNALSQQLYNLDKFRNAILAVPRANKERQPVIYSLQEIFKRMQNCPNNCTSVDVGEFMRSFGRDVYNGSRGNSEYAFFQILNKCDAEFPQKKKCFSKLFIVEKKDLHLCMHCKRVNTSSINQIGFTYNGKQCGVLDNVLSRCCCQEKYRCGNCKKENSLVKRECFQAFGDIFMLWTFCEHPVEYKAIYNFGTNNRYVISGVIMGSSSHAYSYIRNKEENCWYRMNDNSVSKVGDFKDICDECFSKKNGVFVTSLFYEKF